MSKYIITGTLKNGRRFTPIYTDTPWYYNIWSGTIWKTLKDNPRGRKRKRVKTII
jgi:hypothetical protein